MEVHEIGPAYLCFREESEKRRKIFDMDQN